jgi:hypothetical protein
MDVDHGASSGLSGSGRTPTCVDRHYYTFVQLYIACFKMRQNDPHGPSKSLFPEVIHQSTRETVYLERDATRTVDYARTVRTRTGSWTGAMIWNIVSHTKATNM